MASQKHLRSTYFSTPSTLAHSAYPFWSGELFNKGRASAAERIDIDISHTALAGGQLCDDGQWRQIVIIEDALAGGCTLFDLDQLRRENSAEDFKNLFMYEFVDNKASVFPFEELQRCMVDVMDMWEDFAPFADHPLARARSGLAMTRRTLVIAPGVSYSRRRRSLAASSGCWSATSGRGWILPPRPRASAG